MSLRRSARARNPTNEDAAVLPSATSPEVSPARKRKRAGETHTPEPRANGTSTADVASKRSQSPTTPRRSARSGRGGLANSPTPSSATTTTVEQNAESSLQPLDPSTSSSAASSSAPRSVRHAAADAAAISEVAKRMQDGLLPASQELWLEQGDAEKLRTILDSFAPELLQIPLLPQSNFTKLAADSKDKGKGKAAVKSSSTLAEALDGRKLSIRQLKTFALSLQIPLQSQHESGQEAPLLAAANVLLTLVDEIAASQRGGDAGQALATSAVKTESLDSLEALLDGDERPAASSSSSSETQQYALHMRLPTGDYFTKAVKLTPNQAASIDPGLAELIAIEPRATGKSLPKQPTLGERRMRDVSLRLSSETYEDLRERRHKLKAPISVTYGPWLSSLGPTYDSDNSSMSQAARSLVFRSKIDPKVSELRAAWTRVGSGEGEEDEVDLEALAAELQGLEESAMPPPPPPAADIGPADTLFDLDASFDNDVFQSIMASADDRAAIEGRLRYTSALMSQLQEVQTERLRRTSAKMAAAKPEAAVAQTKGNGPLKQAISAVEGDRPGVLERALAQEVLVALGELIAARPTGQSLVPDVEDLRALSRSAAIDPALSSSSSAASSNLERKAGYWGTLDSTLYGPSATARLSRKLPIVVPTFTSNETARLNERSEKAAYAGALASRGVPFGVTRDRGQGLLDRFASLDASRSIVAQNPVQKATAPTKSEGPQMGITLNGSYAPGGHVPTPSPRPHGHSNAHTSGPGGGGGAMSPPSRPIGMGIGMGMGTSPSGPHRSIPSHLPSRSPMSNGIPYPSQAQSHSQGQGQGMTQGQGQGQGAARRSFAPPIAQGTYPPSSGSHHQQNQQHQHQQHHQQHQGMTTKPFLAPPLSHAQPLSHPHPHPHPHLHTRTSASASSSSSASPSISRT